MTGDLSKKLPLLAEVQSKKEENCEDFKGVSKIKRAKFVNDFPTKDPTKPAP